MEECIECMSPECLGYKTTNKSSKNNLEGRQSCKTTYSTNNSSLFIYCEVLLSNVPIDASVLPPSDPFHQDSILLTCFGFSDESFLRVKSDSAFSTLSSVGFWHARRLGQLFLQKKTTSLAKLKGNNLCGRIPLWDV